MKRRKTQTLLNLKHVIPGYAKFFSQSLLRQVSMQAKLAEYIGEGIAPCKVKVTVVRLRKGFASMTHYNVHIPYLRAGMVDIIYILIRR